MKQTRNQFDVMVKETFDSIQRLSAGKGAEYAGDKQHDNEHENFDRLSDRLGLSPEQVLMVYLSKHLDSIDTYVSRLSKDPSKVPEASEPITGRIDDAILYLLLLKGMGWRRHMDDPRASIHVKPGGMACSRFVASDDSVLACRNCGWGRLRHHPRTIEDAIGGLSLDLGDATAENDC